MVNKSNKKSSEDRQVFEISDVLSTPLMPVGTKYMFFEKKFDLEEGNEVVAKAYSGMRRGIITAITDNGICEVNESAVFVNDILYTIV